MVNEDYYTAPINVTKIWLASLLAPLASSILVFLRFYSRKRSKISYGKDDWLSLAAMVLLYGMGIAGLYGVAKQFLGVPLDPMLPVLETLETFKVYFVVCILHISSLACIKISCIIFYRRIFNTGVTQIFNWLSYCTIVIIVVWAVAFIGLNIFHCGLRFEAEHIFVPYWRDRGICMDPLLLQFRFAYTNVVTDAMILSLPLGPWLWKLQMSKKRKAISAFIFAAGSLTIVISVSRLVLIGIVRGSLETGVDLRLSGSLEVYLMILNSGWGLICSCFPSIAGLIASIEPKFWLYKQVNKSTRGQSHDNSVRPSIIDDNLLQSPWGTVTIISGGMGILEGQDIDGIETSSLSGITVETTFEVSYQDKLELATLPNLSQENQVSC